MDLERDDAIGSYRFEHAGNVSRGDRIVWLGAAILSSITEVRHDGRDARGACVLERSNEEQQPTELVVCGFRGAAVETLDDIDIGAADRIKRAHLMLAVFERSLFMRSEIAAEFVRESLAEIGCCLQRKQQKLMAGNGFQRSGPLRPGCAVYGHRLLSFSLQSHSARWRYPFICRARSRQVRQATHERRHRTAPANRRAATASHPRKSSDHSVMPSA